MQTQFVFFRGHFLPQKKPNLPQDSSNSPRTMSSGQSEGSLGGVANAVTRPARSWDGGSLWRSVEFYTLHLLLQQWKPGIWHTTPLPAGARRLHTEQWNFTLKHFRPLCAHVLASLVWKKLRKQKKTEKASAVLLQGFMTNKSLQLASILMF